VLKYETDQTASGTDSFTFKVSDGQKESAVATVNIAINRVAIPPRVEPFGGSYKDSVTVTLTSATPEAKIYYTLDGNEPTSQSTLYSGAFPLAESRTVKAMAVAEGYGESAVTSAAFEVTPTPVTAVCPGRGEGGGGRPGQCRTGGNRSFGIGAQLQGGDASWQGAIGRAERHECGLQRE
jgi:hypothetical protein